MRWARVAAIALAATLTAAGCSDSSRAGEQPPTPTPSTATLTAPSGTGDPSPTPPGPEPTLDPAHAVPPPGPRTGIVAPPDIIVTGADSLDPATVRAIRRLRGVEDAEPISLAQVVIQNKALEVAAVDPATYRNFTPLPSAQSRAVWHRVADGEMALRPAVRRTVPRDADGFVRMGSAQDAPEVHVGAFAPQAEQVDAVVNQTWIPTLGMTPDNAVLVRTGRTAPATLRRPLERLVGRDASVQMVDAVARYGLDPDVVQTAVVVGTVGQAVGTFHYTALGGGRIAPDPAWVRAHIVTERVPILGPVTCNRLMFPQLRAALRDVIAQGLVDKIHPGQYGGCYNPRFIAGTTTLSNHSFGLAIDLNVPENQRGTVGAMDRGVVAIFERWGFTWGGDWSYTDPMHFEMNALVAPR